MRGAIRMLMGAFTNALKSPGPFFAVFIVTSAIELFSVTLLTTAFTVSCTGQTLSLNAVIFA